MKCAIVIGWLYPDAECSWIRTTRFVIVPIVNLTMAGSNNGMPEWKDPGAFLANVANEEITDVYDRMI